MDKMIDIKEKKWNYVNIIAYNIVKWMLWLFLIPFWY